MAGSVDVEPDVLVQEALVRTMRKGPISDLDNPLAFLRNTIVNLASNQRRSLGRKRKALGRRSFEEGWLPGWLVLVWLVFLATAFRYLGRGNLWVDLVATVSPQRAQQLEMKRLLQLVETAPGPVYGLSEWEGPRQIGGHGRSSLEGLTHLQLIYESPIDEPHVRVNTIWQRSNRPDISIQDVRSRLARGLWHRQLHPR